MNENESFNNRYSSNDIDDEPDFKSENYIDSVQIIENFRLLGKDYSSGMSQIELMLRNGQFIHEPHVTDYVEVLIKGNITKICSNPQKLPLHIAQFVFIESNDVIIAGLVYGLGTKAKLKASKSDYVHSVILRIANKDEIEIYKRHLIEEDEIVAKTTELALEHNLDMKVTEAEWQYDRQKLTIYFTAPDRVDFRELVKELAWLFKTRIELRQISSRDETRRSCCSVGPCGRELCCQTFLQNFDHITLDHARTQRLVSNLSKLTGNCGRLKCCLKYEYDVYADSFDVIPPINSVIETERGVAKIVKIDIYKEICICYLDEYGGYIEITFEEVYKYVENGKVFTPKNIEGENFYPIETSQFINPQQDFEAELLDLDNDEYISIDDIIQNKLLNKDFIVQKETKIIEQQNQSEKYNKNEKENYSIKKFEKKEENKPKVIINKKKKFYNNKNRNNEN